jgi:hypothetical protein
MKTRVETQVLLATIRANRQRHIERFNEAATGYLVAFNKLFDDYARYVRTLTPEYLAKFCCIKDIEFPSDRPDCHAVEYDRIIGMLEMTTDGFVDLGESEYRQYVRDEWAWSGNFSSSCSSYSSSSERSSESHG